MSMQHPDNKNKIFAKPDWQAIDTVLLDLDGTLLDRHFDDYFWDQYLPEHYSLRHDISIAKAKAELSERYRSVQHTLKWADIDFWTRELGMDIGELKMRVNHLIRVHPYVLEFLETCASRGKGLYLITNAHAETLEIKLSKTALGAWFDRIVCASEMGFAKEENEFWVRLCDGLELDPARCLLVDDTAQVLNTAAAFGIGHLIFVARPSSRQPASYSDTFPSIDFFKEILPS
jgi:5'-nucleotidase